MTVNPKKILYQFSIFKKYAEKHYQNGNIELAIKYIELCARLGYNYNFKYCDDELEELISKIVKSKKLDLTIFVPNKNRLVFYDSFAIDNRGLSQQYLTALLDLKFEILFICSNKKVGNIILNLIKDKSNVRLLHLDKDNFLENYENAVNEIINFKPLYILQHFSPWDVLGCCIGVSINSAKRYLINLTDHAFWLGRNNSDFVLEFRSYGAFISNNERKISFDKLLLQPYYPVQNNSNFKGLPILNSSNKKILFAGSAFYKIYGRNGLFLNLIKRILDENENTVFLFAGDGNKRPILEFINKNKFQDRFFLLGNRNDINEVFKEIDIYINTYPMIGGLMSQYAAINRKPIIGYTDEALFCINDTEDFLQIKEKGFLVKKTIDEFCSYIQKLINIQSEYDKNVEITKECIISVEDFKEKLFSNLIVPKCLDKEFVKNIKIDVAEINELYVDMEVNYIGQHYLLIWNVLGIMIFRDNCKIGLFSVWSKVVLFIHSKVKFVYKKLRFVFLF